MKKIQLSIIALATMLATSCGLGTPGTTTNTTTNVLGEVLSGVINGGNTYVTFLQDMTFKAAFGGREFSGTYTYDESSSKVVLKSLLFNFTCYAKKNADGIGLLFDASKLLTMLQMASAVSSNSTLQTVSDLSKNYDGVRLGFDFK